MTSESSSTRVPGVAIAVVTDNQDPDGEARVKVKYPWRDIEGESFLARITTIMAGNDMGVYFLLEVDDEVVVAFVNGDIACGGLLLAPTGPLSDVEHSLILECAHVR